MKPPRLLYVETVAAEALELSEDIAYLAQAKDALAKVNGLDEELKQQAWNTLNTMERQIRYYIRHKFIQTKPKQVSEALRKRLKEELRKELIHEEL